jgi:hypothetical protein
VAAAVWHAAHLELLISGHHRESVEAFYLAESGWNKYLAEHVRSADPLDRLFAFPQGSVRVVVERVVIATPDTAVFALTSTGHRVRAGGRAAARRSVRLLVIRDGAGQLIPWPGTWREVW